MQREEEKRSDDGGRERGVNLRLEEMSQCLWSNAIEMVDAGSIERERRSKLQLCVVAESIKISIFVPFF